MAMAGCSMHGKTVVPLGVMGSCRWMIVSEQAICGTLKCQDRSRQDHPGSISAETVVYVRCLRVG